MLKSVLFDPFRASEKVQQRKRQVYNEKSWNIEKVRDWKILPPLIKYVGNNKVFIVW